MKRRAAANQAQQPISRRRTTMAHPRMYDESDESIERLRDICLGFPEVVEKEAWGECTFRVASGRMFAMTDNDHHDSGHLAVWIMAPPSVQETLIGSMPRRFFKPPYVGGKGWVGVRLDAKVDWDELAGILRDGYLMAAPARVSSRRASGSEKSPARGQKWVIGEQSGKERRAARRNR
jgi:hypothetical protein